MRTEVIKADTIDVAVERILVELGKDTTSSRENAIYFDGWDGLGASAVLQAVAKRLGVSNEPSMRLAGLEFEKIIHIDCSKWESRRAMQREIAEQLNLPNWVMEMFGKQDEEDDFNGLDQGSRTEIAQVVREIYQTVQNHRFLVILHNGSNEEIDILNFGLSLYGYANSKMLWTFQGRFRLDPKMIDNVKKSTTTYVLFSASRDLRDPLDLWLYLVHHEAAQISFDKHGHGVIDPGIAAKCVLYMLKQSWIGSRGHIIEHDWAIHTSNYWACDGIITLTEIDQAWQVCNCLQNELLLSLDMDNQLNNDESRVMPSSSHMARFVERMPYWISTSTCGFVLNPSGVIPNNLFQHSHRLGVLKLSRCTFSFSSPPFLCCQSIRFLWLDHCQDLPTRSSTTDHHDTDADEEELDNSTSKSWVCFLGLWVLDLRYTGCDWILSARVLDLMTQLRELNVMGAESWDMNHLQGRLPNIRRLRVTKSTCFFNKNVFSEMESMELLDFSGNTITQGMKSLSGPTSNNCLKTVTVDGCYGLEIISFRGCKELKNLFLKGLLWNLKELDLSGTRVKTLDLREVEASSFPFGIILLGCEKLHAILWPQGLKSQEWRQNDYLCVDTTSTSASDGGKAACAHPYGDQFLHQQKEEMFKGGWRISLMDTRLLRSLSPFKHYLKGSTLHIDICPAASVDGSNTPGTSSDKLMQVQPHISTFMDSKYSNVLKDGPIVDMMMWDCPIIFLRQENRRTCIIKVIMHGQDGKLLEDAPSASSGTLLLPDFICEEATSLHVYDNSSITSVPAPPQGSGWKFLRWCRVERCPKLHTVFTVPQGSNANNFYYLQTLWASHLLYAHYIWDRPVKGYFQFLKFLHLDNCPRLIHVLPFSIWERDILSELETLEIVYCGDLREVFPLGPELQEQDKIREFPEQDKIIEFPKLRRIHLRELPMLQAICGCRMSAPNLETIDVRGCWSLTHVPYAGYNTELVEVNCEREWWENLEWDGLERNHHPSLDDPRHSWYFKKGNLPRGSLLR